MMKNRIRYLIPLLLTVLWLSGCGRRGAVEYSALAQAGSESSETAGTESGEENEGETGEGASSEEAASGESDRISQTDEKTGEASASSGEEEASGTIYVDISGAVHAPGVYELVTGSRMFQAVEAAGGFTEQAEKRCINQADLLSDGEKIYVYSKEEAEELGGWMQLSGAGAVQQSAGASGQSGASASESDGKVNLNTADKSQLMTLSGVGEARAEAIIAYRETNGAFSSIEDIMNVAGIKEKVFEQIKDQITV